MRATAAALSIAGLAACAQHQERELTAWLKVDLVRPATGTSGTFVVGRNEEVFHARVGKGWTRLGSGHPCRYMVLNDANKEYYDKDSQPAALVDLNDRKGVQIVRAGERALRPVQDLFGAAEFTVPPSRTVIDVLHCRDRAADVGCQDLQIDRHQPHGSLVKTFRVELGEAYPECGIVGIRWYDSVEIPVLDARCTMESERAQCLWLMPRDEGLVVHAVGRDRPPRECSDSPRLNVALSRVERFEVLH